MDGSKKAVNLRSGKLIEQDTNRTTAEKSLYIWQLPMCRPSTVMGVYMSLSRTLLCKISNVTRQINDDIAQGIDVPRRCCVQLWYFALGKGHWLLLQAECQFLGTADVLNAAIFSKPHCWKSSSSLKLWFYLSCKGDAVCSKNTAKKCINNL